MRVADWSGCLAPIVAELTRQHCWFPSSSLGTSRPTRPLFFRSRPEVLQHIVIQHDGDARLSRPQSVQVLHLGGTRRASQVVFTLHRLATAPPSPRVAYRSFLAKRAWKLS